jgi:cellulose biosynthesis protein BcsQ
MTANLAAVIAGEERRVAVIDTDIQSPGLHVLFGLSGDQITWLHQHDAFERGDWIVAFDRPAPGDAQVAVIASEGVDHRLPVEAGVYAFTTRVATEPEPTMTRSRFE